jgi:hypothetical protein
VIDPDHLFVESCLALGLIASERTLVRHDVFRA